MRKVIFWESLSHIAGGQRVLLSLLPYFAKDFSISIILPKEGDLYVACKEFGVNINCIPMGFYSRGKKSAYDVFNFICKTPNIIIQGIRICKGADLIYVNSTQVFPWAVVVGTFLRIPVLLHSHVFLSDRAIRVAVQFFAFFPIVKKILAVSESVYRQFQHHIEKSELIMNGVDTNLFRPTEVQNYSRQAIWRIGIVGDIIPQKGHTTLVRAASVLSKKGMRFHIAIVGKPRKDSIAFANELQAAISGFKLQDRIEFWGQADNMQMMYANFDLVVVPSIAPEACPMVICESFACGVPVIASDIGSIPAIISNNKNGYLFKIGDERDLAEKIESYFSDRDEMRMMSIRCREYAHENFNLERLCRRIGKIMCDIS
jgi:glycosyltransferase involved in cell wall biosynthesis